jgi:hypothetical protein
MASLPEIERTSTWPHLPNPAMPARTVMAFLPEFVACQGMIGSRAVWKNAENT